MEKKLPDLSIWDDTSSPEFAAEAKRQSLLIANDPHEKEIMDWIEEATADLFKDDPWDD